MKIENYWSPHISFHPIPSPRSLRIDPVLLFTTPTSLSAGKLDSARRTTSFASPKSHRTSTRRWRNASLSLAARAKSMKCRLVISDTPPGRACSSTSAPSVAILRKEVRSVNVSAKERMQRCVVSGCVSLAKRETIEGRRVGAYVCAEGGMWKCCWGLMALG